MPPKSRFLPRAMLAVAALAIVLAAVAFLARGAIATHFARPALEEHGVVCDERFALELNATLSEASVGPTRCTIERGLIEAVELPMPATVRLDGFTPVAIAADSARLELAAVDVRGGDGWAGPLRRLGLEQQVAGLVKGLSEMSRVRELPPLDVVSLEVVRGGETIMRLTRLALRTEAIGVAIPPDTTHVTIERVAFGGGGPSLGSLTLAQVRGMASPTSVQLAGQAEASAGVGIFSLSTAGNFRIDARGLDTASPRFSLDGSFGS